MNKPSSRDHWWPVAFIRSLPRQIRTMGSVMAVALLCAGCLAGIQTKGEESGQEPAAQPLIKPFLPQDSAQDAQVTAARVQPPLQSEAFPKESSSGVETDLQTKRQREVAADLAKPSPFDVKGETQSPREARREVKPFTQSPSAVRSAPEVKKQAQKASQREPEQKAVSQVASGAIPARQQSVRESDEQKVRKAALEKVREFPTVTKMKICYAVKDDEWWVIMYEESGSHYDLKQFVWDKERERLDPFLVLRRIAADQLQKHLTAAEPDRACEIMDIEPGPAHRDDSKPSGQGS